MKDWFLREWMQQQGKRQAGIIRELGWERGRTSKIYNGKQPYARGDVVALAEWLGIEPFELLMSPAEALRLRNIRMLAVQIAEEDPPPFAPAPPAKVRRSGSG